MTIATLQLQLPADPTLSDDQLVRITGRAHVAKQMAWLDEHGWPYELSAKGELVVGTLYANLRLAGLAPTAVETAAAGGFDLSKAR
jgi:hypothetical protein